jgi:hypothetical protein
MNNYDIRTEIEKVREAILEIDNQKIIAKNKLKNLKFWQFSKKNKLKTRIEKCEFYALDLFITLKLLEAIKSK